MSKWGSASYCYQCEKNIPWSSRCVYCRNPLCRNVGSDGQLTCRCNCQLAQPNAIPMNPGKPTRSVYSDARQIAERARLAKVAK